MKVAEFDRIKNLSIIEAEMPKVKNGEVLIKPVLSGICGSEVHAYLGMHPFRKPPSVLGHEVVGEVVDIGKSVSGFSKGDLVTVEPHFGCGDCPSCNTGKYHLCDSKTILGTPQWKGSYAEYFVSPEKCVYHIPEGLSPELAVLTEPLAVGVHAVRRAKVKKGENAVILGGGPIGLLTAVSALEAGADKVVITDAVDLNLEVARKLGVAKAINVTKDSLNDYIKKKNLQVDHIFITVGIPAVVKEAVEVLKKDGTITSIALFEEIVGLDFNTIMRKEVKLQGSSMYVKEDFEQAISIIQRGEYDLKTLITKTYPFRKIKEAMDDNVLHASQTIKTIVKYD